MKRTCLWITYSVYKASFVNHITSLLFIAVSPIVVNMRNLLCGMSDLGVYVWNQAFSSIYCRQTNLISFKLSEIGFLLS